MPRIGIGLGLGLFGTPSGGGFDADYQAVLTYATTQGYTLPSASQQTLQNQLVVDLKAGGIWNKLDVFYCFANNGGDNFATLNWKSPSTRQITKVSTPNFITNQGYQGTGLSYLSTNFNSSIGTNNYVQDNASRNIYLYAEGISADVSLDGTVSTTNNGIRRASTTAQRINQGTAGISSAVDFTATKQMKSIHRTSSTNVECFNGTTQSSRTATSAALANSAQFVLRGANLSTFGTHTISMYSMGSNLVAENTAYTTAFETYINSL
jgi:hypothetical protein